MLAGLGHGRPPAAAVDDAAASQCQFGGLPPETQPADTGASQPLFAGQRSPVRFTGFSQPSRYLGGGSQLGGQPPAAPPPAPAPQRRPELQQLLAPRRRLIAPLGPGARPATAPPEHGQGQGGAFSQGPSPLGLQLGTQASQPQPQPQQQLFQAAAVFSQSQQQQQQQQPTPFQAPQPFSQFAPFSQPEPQGGGSQRGAHESLEATQQAPAARPAASQATGQRAAASQATGQRPMFCLSADGLAQPPPSQPSQAKAAAAANAAALLERLAQKSAVEAASGAMLQRLEGVAAQCQETAAATRELQAKAAAHEAVLLEVKGTCQQMLGLLQALVSAQATRQPPAQAQEGAAAGKPCAEPADSAGSSERGANKENEPPGQQQPLAGGKARPHRRPKPKPPKGSPPEEPAAGGGARQAPKRAKRPQAGGKATAFEMPGSDSEWEPAATDKPSGSAAASDGSLWGRLACPPKRKRTGGVGGQQALAEAAAAGKAAGRRSSQATGRGSSKAGGRQGSRVGRQGARRQPVTVSALRRFLADGTAECGQAGGCEPPEDEQEMGLRIARRLERHRAKRLKQ